MTPIAPEPVASLRSTLPKKRTGLATSGPNERRDAVVREPSVRPLRETRYRFELIPPTSVDPNPPSDP